MNGIRKTHVKIGIINRVEEDISLVNWLGSQMDSSGFDPSCLQSIDAEAATTCSLSSMGLLYCVYCCWPVDYVVCCLFTAGWTTNCPLGDNEDSHDAMLDP